MSISHGRKRGCGAAAWPWIELSGREIGRAAVTSANKQNTLLPGVGRNFRKSTWVFGFQKFLELNEIKFAEFKEIVF